jgi:hypothetical protein
MLFNNEETKQNPLKDIETLDLAFPKIPTKASYKLQVSIMQDIQSIGRFDGTKLTIGTERQYLFERGSWPRRER